MKIAVQDLLVKMGSGLAAASFYNGGRAWTAGAWIQHAADTFRIQPAYILTTLQAEQGLMRDKTPRPAAYRIEDLPYYGQDYPAAELIPAGAARIVRNIKRPDGRPWWLACYGDKKMIAACGTGIPDPKAVPPWDVRPFLGFDNQVLQCARLLSKYLDEYGKGSREIQLYPNSAFPQGETVVANDAETFALLRYTPAENVLKERPAIYRGIISAMEA